MLPSPLLHPRTSTLQTNQSMNMKFACPQCQGHIEAEPAWAGLVSPCPHCGTSIQVPHQAVALKPVPPPARSASPKGKSYIRLAIILVIGLISLGFVWRYSQSTKQPVSSDSKKARFEVLGDGYEMSRGILRDADGKVQVYDDPEEYQAAKEEKREREQAAREERNKDRESTCSFCNGTGKGNSCPRCLGQGTHRTASGLNVVCDECKGYPNKCTYCKGKGKISTASLLDR